MISWFSGSNPGPPSAAKGAGCNSRDDSRESNGSTAVAYSVARCGTVDAFCCAGIAYGALQLLPPDRVQISSFFERNTKPSDYLSRPAEKAKRKQLTKNRRGVHIRARQICGVSTRLQE